MVDKVILPKLGQTMEEGTIIEWLKKEGDPVKRGDLLFIFESDKATLEVEATARGFLRKILVPVGETVPVLTAVALITRTADEEIEGYEVEGSKVQVEAQDLALEPAALQPAILEPETLHPATFPEHSRRAGRIFASPRARKVAREKEVNLALVTGTGPNGRIVERDVLAYLTLRPKVTPMALKAAEAFDVDIATVSGTGVSGRVMKADVAAAAQAAAVWPPQPPAPPVGVPAVESVPLTGLRRIIAERMAASVHTAARVTLVTEADATAFVEARERLKAT
nr:2-oxo acid dehydrogenase subunit E2 [Anaerolineae bacterium]